MGRAAIDAVMTFPYSSDAKIPPSRDSMICSDDMIAQKSPPVMLPGLICPSNHIVGIASNSPIAVAVGGGTLGCAAMVAAVLAPCSQPACVRKSLEKICCSSGAPHLIASEAQPQT